ncbi:hypothetical protein DXG01_001868 [Tephrocybe rancida]|nr:hypothetical protein DXG01_001868 [Tephrocybe rancida]
MSIVYRFPHGLDMSVDEFGDIKLMEDGVVRDMLPLDIVPGQTIWAHSFEYNLCSFLTTNGRSIIVEHSRGKIDVTIPETPSFAAPDVAMMLMLTDFSVTDRRDMHRFPRPMDMSVNESGDIVLTDNGIVRNGIKLDIIPGQAIRVHAFIYSLASLHATKGRNFIIKSPLMGGQINVAISRPETRPPSGLASLPVPEKVSTEQPTLTVIAVLRFVQNLLSISYSI